MAPCQGIAWRPASSSSLLTLLSQEALKQEVIADSNKSCSLCVLQMELQTDEGSKELDTSGLIQPSEPNDE